MLGSMENIISMRLFGSHARGEADLGSDIDILLVVENGYLEPCSEKFPRKADISVYSRDKLEQMFQEGHLFAWHLFLESVPYCSARSEAWFMSLGTPAEYREAREDITQFMGIIEDALASMESEDCYIYEAGILHLAMRNLGMILGYLHTGKPNFSRYSALQLPEKFAPSISAPEYEMLLACRRASTRADTSGELPSYQQVGRLSFAIRDWLDKLNLICHSKVVG